MTALPEITTYGNYSSGNYGAHALRVRIAGLTVWFSYQTPIAFQLHGQARVVRENGWGPTTGKHLNWIEPDHGKRVDSETFERLWKEQVEAMLAGHALTS